MQIVPPRVSRFLSTSLALIMLSIGFSEAIAQSDKDNTATAADQRVVSIGGSITEIVYALGAESTLVGNDTTSYYPEAAESLPKVGYLRALSAEGILSLSPDRILLSYDAGPPSVLAQLEQAGVEMITLTSARSIEDIVSHVETIGEALDKSTEADKLINRIQSQQQTLQAMRCSNPTVEQRCKPPRVLFILQHGGGGPMVAGRDTAAASLIELAGGINSITEFQGYKPLTAESAVALNPDVILITDQGLEQAGGKASLSQSAGLSLTSAAEHGQIFSMDSLELLGFGPRTVEAAIRLHEYLYADALVLQ